MTELIPAFAAGWLICLCLLSIFHLLWKHAHRTVRYLLGGGAICAGCAMAGAILDMPVLMFGPGCIASAGLIIALWTWIEERTDKKLKSAQKNGEIIGATRGLTQEIIDSGSHSPRSQN